jgi:hypothetical protein
MIQKARSFLFIWLACAACLGLQAQYARNMFMNLPSKTTPGRYFQKVISIFPYYFNDTMTDAQLLSSFMYLPPLKKGTPYYVLDAKDSLRIAATILQKGNKFVVTHYEGSGAVTSRPNTTRSAKPMGSSPNIFPIRNASPTAGPKKNGK